MAHTRDSRLALPFHAQVIGLGPAALGIAVAADRAGVLAWLLRAGIVFLESQRSLVALARQRFPYVITSNSRAADFLEAIDPRGAFAGALDGAPAAALRAAGGGVVSLRCVGELMNELTAILARLCETSARSAIRFASHVHRVVRGRDGLLAAVSSDGTVLGVSHHVVLATGATEDFALAQAAADVDPAMIVLSNAVLRGDLDRVSAAVDAGLNIYVLGSAHSALSAIAVVLAAFDGRLYPGQIGLVCRNVKVHAPAAAGESERHRFDGLRGDAKALYARIAGGEERAVELIAPEALRTRARRALYISAVGYTCRAVEIVDEQAGRIPVWIDAKGVRVDDDCNVLDIHGDPIRNMYALGAGHARRSSDGVARVGVNLFHGDDGLEIARRLMPQHDETRSAPAAAVPGT